MESATMRLTKTRPGVACNEHPAADGHLGVSKEPLMSDIIADSPSSAINSLSFMQLYRAASQAVR